MRRKAAYFPSGSKINRLIFPLLLVLLLPYSFTGANLENLPEMGEPVDQTLSPQQEKAIGRQFMRQARAQLPLVEDHALNEYLQRLGERLLTGMNGVDYDFTFFLIKDNSINAFAVPGGYIGINSGLINHFRLESQVAAVIAHEIAHVTQRHHARAYSAQGNSGLTAAAAILAAIVLSQHSADAGHAALATGMAVSQQSQINYTRANEYEADRIGIEILTDAGFAPSGMAGAFDILRRNNSLNTAGMEIEYLRTHPLGDNRIAEARNRANAVGAKGEKDSLSFRLFKTRLAVLSSQDHAYLRRLYLSRKSDDEFSATDYGLALLDKESRDYIQALKRTRSLLENGKDDFLIRLLYAELLFRTGDKIGAEDEFISLLDLHPTRYSAVQIYAELLLEAEDLNRAYDLLVRYERRNARINPDVFRQLAQVRQKQMDQTASHEYLASYYEKTSEPGEAIKQLELALNTVKKGSQAELRISARLKRMQSLRTSNKRKRPSDNENLR